MTVQEASERYNIPVKILQEYESWGLCDAVKNVMGVWQYDDEDINRLSMIMTLHDIGFEKEEVECYMKLLLAGESTQEERMRMLNEKRDGTLDEIHFKEKQLDRLDYLRYEIKKSIPGIETKGEKCNEKRFGKCISAVSHTADCGRSSGK